VAQLAPRPRVTDVEAKVIEETIDEGYGPVTVWFAWVWPSSNGQPLAELSVDAGTDLEQWFDDSGYEWPPETRAKLRSQLPRTERSRRQIIAAGALGPQVENGVAALLEHNEPPMFYRRAGVPMEIRSNERQVPYMAPVTVGRMRDRQRQVAEWIEPKSQSEVKPPADVCGIILESPELHLPALETIVEHPVMSRRGITVRRGYDRDSGVFFAPSLPLPSLDVPRHPDDSAVRVALSHIDELLYDFPFRSAADKANAVAMMLTPILRPIIPGGVPLAAVRAVKPGTGKTLLVKAMLHTLTGRDVGFTSLGTDENEAEKRLLADLLAGGQFVILDNVETGSVLKSAALARALTTGVLSGRIITTSKHVSLPVRCTWIATGNALTMSDEIARRAYLVEFSPELERPDLRSDQGYAFLHADLLGWVAENRPRLLSAFLVISQAWHAAGMPITVGPVLASYEDWSMTVGSVLRNAAEVGWGDGREFLGNEGRKREVAEDPTSLERSILLRVIGEVVGERSFGFQQLWQDTQPRVALGDGEDARGLANHNELAARMTAAVQPFLAPRERWSDESAPKTLGYAVRPWVDGVYGGLRLTRDTRGKYGQRFRVDGEAVDEGSG
jgi:hypothetical protein